MYSIVLMVAATSGGDMASFGGKDKAGCHGTVVSAGCTGTVASTSCHGSSCHGSGIFGLRNGGGLFSKKGGCHGSCHGTPTGCTGYTPAAPAVVAAPTGCTGYTSTGCHGSSCHGGGIFGLRSSGGLFNKKGGCHGSCHGS